MRRRQIVKTSVVLFALVAMVAVSGPAIAVSGDPQPQTLPPGAAAPTPTGPPQVFDAWGLRDSLLKTQPSSFAGLYGDGNGGLVVLATAGNGALISQTTTELANQSSAAVPRFAVKEVTTSLSQLINFRTALLDHGEKLDGGNLLTQIGVDDLNNQLLVGLRDNTPEGQGEVMRLLGARADQVRFVQQDVVPPTVDRENDVAPWNAGDRTFMENSMYNNYYGWCSSGFGVHNPNTGHHYLLTAAHCSWIAGQGDFFLERTSVESSARWHGLLDRYAVRDQLVRLATHRHVVEHHLVDRNRDT